MNLTVRINLDGGASNGKFTCTIRDEEGLAGGPFTGYLGILDPNGNEVSDILSAISPTFASSGQTSAEFDIPVNADGYYIPGQYTFSFRVLDSLSAVVGERSVVYDFVPNVWMPTGSATSNLTGSALIIEYQMDCNGRQLTVEGITNDAGWIRTGQEQSFTPPPSAADLHPAEQTNSSTSAVFSAPTDGQYFIGSTVNRNYSELIAGGGSNQVTLEIYEELYAFKYVSVNCEGYCDMLAKLECIYNENFGDAAVNLTIDKLIPIVDTMLKSLLAFSAKECGNFTKEQTYLASVEESGCGCGCSDC